MDPVQNIKSRLDIVDVVQDYLPLKPAGTGSFKGLCPFHHEKTPSFFANRPRQSWHCFGCNEGGDIISFVMRMEGLEFREVLELLAQKTGVVLPAYNPQKNSERQRLYEVNDLAARWFHSQLLYEQNGETARQYLIKRGLDQITVDNWRLGYAPADWDALINALKQKNVSVDELIKVGLAVKSEKGPGIFSRFRGRLMIPILDAQGHVIGFTGRILDANAKEAKYVNTPETVLYKKSAVLYGLDKAKGEIKRQDLAVVVEGNMDVIASHQIGITNVVASSGTALTEEQLFILKRYTQNLAIAFDQDSAGTAATLRGLDLARRLDFNIRIISLSFVGVKDPDEAVRKDPEIWRDAIKNAHGIIDWLYHKAFGSHDSTKPENKKLVARELLPELRLVADPVERDAWITKLSKDLEISADSLREGMRRIRPASEVLGPKLSTTPTQDQGLRTKDTASREEQLKERLLAILQISPELHPLAEKNLGEYPLDLDIDPNFANYLAILADREFEDHSASTLERELMMATASLRSLYRSRELARLEQEMRQAELVGDAATIQALLTQFKSMSDSGGPRA